MSHANRIRSGNDAEFRQAERDWYSFVAKLTERLTEIDDTIPELPVKDVVRFYGDFIMRSILFTFVVVQIFRIYRDVRFTSDPTPYKVSVKRPARIPSAPAHRPASLMHKHCSHIFRSRFHGPDER